MNSTDQVVLVIESDTQELRRLRELLTREGYSIMTASDYETARQLSERIRFGLVIGNAEVMGFGPGQEMHKH